MRRTKDNSRDVLKMDSDPEVWRDGYASHSRTQLRDDIPASSAIETAADVTIDNVSGPAPAPGAHDPSLADGDTAVCAVDVRDGVLWCFGYRSLATFDGDTWQHIRHPDNV